MTEAGLVAKKSLWPYWVGVGIVVVAGVSWFAYRKNPKLELTYREIKVERENLEVKVLGTGTVQPENRVEIKPPVPGRIEQVLVKEGQLVKKGQILAWMSSTERAALLDAARSRGSVEYKRWEDNYNPTPIMAPINGTLILRNVETGQTFTNVDSVFVMSDRLIVKALVDETDIATIKVKQKAIITLDAYPNDVIPAVVAQIAYEAKTVSNVTTYEVDVLPEKIPSFMRSGMTANVTFMVANRTGTIAIPNDALRVQDNQYSVLVKGAQANQNEERIVEVGITDGKKTEVLKGLNEGELILAAEVNISKSGKAQGSGNPFSSFGGGGGRRSGGGH
jgi:macrolide-specific efflux system membrane fusion protein